MNEGWLRSEPVKDAFLSVDRADIVVMQLEQLEARPGHKILEGGAATGCNATLLSHLVDPAGPVFTLDADEDLIEGARRNLASAGVSNVTVLLGDAAIEVATFVPLRKGILDDVQTDVPFGPGDVAMETSAKDVFGRCCF